MVDDVSCGPIAQSQSPPPAVWSGWPMYVALDPSWVTRQALQPAGTPVGPITNERPNRSVRMLGSAVLVLPWRSRLGLNIDPLLGFAALGALAASAAAAAGPSSVSGSRPRAVTARTPTSRRMTLILISPSYLARKL